MGEKSAQNLIDAIEQSKNQSLDRVIYALGIRFVGKTVARDLAAAFGSMDELMSASEETLTSIDSIGPKIAESVAAFFSKSHNIHIVETLRSHGLTFEKEEREEASSLLEGKKFALTGSLPTFTRKEATDLIRKHGGDTSSSVSSKTDYLLAGESAGSKYDKARELGIPILNESSFLEMIGEED
jgi:DNA ligase (NAD+)